MANTDFGIMYLIKDRVLITRSSSSILLFKLQDDGSWTEHYRFNKLRGQVYYIKGTLRFQICSDQKIYFVILDKETLLPRVENVMFNSTGSFQMIIGTKSRYSITFRMKQSGFMVMSKKHTNNFRVEVTTANVEGSVGVNIPSINAYVGCEKLKIGVYDDKTFEVKQQWRAIQSQGKIDIEILYITVSDDESRIALALGKQLVKDHQHIEEIVVYEKKMDGKFDLQKICDFEFHEACIYFKFSVSSQEDLLFFTERSVLVWNYMVEGAYQILYAFRNPLGEQPRMGVFSDDQTKFIVTAVNNTLYVDTTNDIEIDLDLEEDIDLVKSIMFHDGHFYLVANKLGGRLGFFLIDIDTSVIRSSFEYSAEYVIQWPNKLDLDNCDQSIMKELDQETGEEKKRIVVSFKQNHINTYNVFVIDLESRVILYWHEGYQLWESPIKGFLLSTNDFLTYSKDGISVLSLGEKAARVIKDQEGMDQKIHSLGACNYLKVEPTNSLFFR